MVHKTRQKNDSFVITHFIIIDVLWNISNGNRVTFAFQIIDVKRLEFHESLAAIKNADNILITTHRSPDGDAIGSSLGMLGFIEKLGKKARVVVPDAFPEFLNWISGTENITRYDTNKELVTKWVEESDLIMSLDYNTMSRVGNEFGEILQNAGKDMIIVDHHREPDEHFTHYIHDIESCSTAQLVLDFIDLTGNLDLMTLDMAEAIYTGILTDTGSFRFPSTSARTHEIVGLLMNKGLQVSKVYNAIYDTNSFDRLQLLGYTLSQKMKHFPELNLAYIVLSYEEMQRFNFKSGDTEGFVNYALSIKGVNFSCLMKESDDGKVKMSFRSKGDFDVNTFARTNFNGGGHLNAAGGISFTSLEETEKLFFAKAQETIAEHS